MELGRELKDRSCTQLATVLILRKNYNILKKKGLS